MFLFYNVYIGYIMQILYIIIIVFAEKLYFGYIMEIRRIIIDIFISVIDYYHYYLKRSAVQG